MSDENLQEVLDDTLPGGWYYSDRLAAHQELAYDFGIHFPMNNKSQTYSVEADNAELRHYLARLGRRSRCFSRSIHALWRALRLFVFAWTSASFTGCAFLTTLLIYSISCRHAFRHSLTTKSVAFPPRSTQSPM